MRIQMHPVSDVLAEIHSSLNIRTCIMYIITITSQLPVEIPQLVVY